MTDEGKKGKSRKNRKLPRVIQSLGPKGLEPSEKTKAELRRLYRWEKNSEAENWVIGEPRP